MESTKNNANHEHKGAQTMNLNQTAAQTVAELQARKAEILAEAARKIQNLDEQIADQNRQMLARARTNRAESREVYAEILEASLDLRDLEWRLFERLAATNLLQLDAPPATTQRYAIVEL